MLQEISTLEFIGLFGSVIGASMLANIVGEIRKRIGSDKRLRFWIFLVSYLVINAVRLMARTMHWLTPDSNVALDCVLQLTITAYFIYYIHSNYLKK